jgi:hypothetical protein
VVAQPVRDSSPQPQLQQRPCLVRVAIPHYHLGLAGSEGHGALRGEEAQLRVIALARCIGAVLALARSERDDLLEIADQTIRPTPLPRYPERRLTGVWVDCHVFVTGTAWQQEVLAGFERRIRVHRLQLEDPRSLPAAARDFLLHEEAGEADLYLYLEDDLVINDRLYVDKLLWFCERTQHRFALMPHRYELTGSAAVARLFVDGPIDGDYLRQFQEPQEGVAKGRFWDGQEVCFDVASNPHSGSFALSRAQRQLLHAEGVAPKEFVGPLETVATGTVLAAFPVWKPSWACRDFLQLEHAHPSFLQERHRLPRAPGS